MLHRVSNTEESQLLQKMIIEDAQRELLLEMGDINAHYETSVSREDARTAIGICFMFATTAQNPPFLAIYNNEKNVIEDTRLARRVDDYFTIFSDAVIGRNNVGNKPILKKIPRSIVEDYGNLVTNLAKNPDVKRIQLFKNLHRILYNTLYPPRNEVRKANEVDNMTKRMNMTMKVISKNAEICKEFIDNNLSNYVSAGFIDPQEAATIQQQFQTQYPNGIVRRKPRKWR